MAIIYLILAQRQPDLLVRLVSTLNDQESNFVIHVDKKGSINNFAARIELPTNKIHFLKKRYSTEWGNFGIIKAILSGFRHIKRNFKETDRIVLLSDQDYPIKSNDYIKAYFLNNPEVIFIDNFRISSDGLYKNWTTRFPSFQSIEKSMPIYSGLLRFSFPVETINPIFEFLNLNPDYLKYFKLVQLPEESFFQTLLMNTEVEPLIDRITQNKVHFRIFSEHSTSERILTTEDFKSLIDNDHLFARKFHPIISGNLLNQIDVQILRSGSVPNGFEDRDKGAILKGNAILLLSDKPNDSTLQLYANLNKGVAKQNQTFILYHAQDKEILPDSFRQLDSASVIPFDNSILTTSGYQPITTKLIPGSNHFPLLQFYLKNPGYDFYWQIEDDVHYSGRWKEFFEYFIDKKITSDFLSTNIKSFNDEPFWHWWDTLHHPQGLIPNETKLRSFNPIFRISNAALEFLHNKLSNDWMGHHEVLIPTLLNQEGFSINDFGGSGDYVLPECEHKFYLPSHPTQNGALNTGSMRHRPIIEQTEIKPNLLYHPVKFANSEYKRRDDSKCHLGLKTTFIVIVTYNGIRFIPKCLESTAAAVPQNQIIIVDNSSTDGGDIYIEKNFPEVTIIRNRENLGFGKANNIGIQKALISGAEYVLLLNQDAYLTSNCLDALHTAALENPSYGVISPIHLRGNGSSLDFHFHSYISHLKEFWSAIYLNQTIRDIYQVGFVNAACWYLTRPCIEKVGGFDPDFFLYGEDDDFINRAHYHGFKVGIVPHTQVIHDRGDVNNFTKWDKVDQIYNRLHIELKDINRPFSPTFKRTIINNLLFNAFESLIKFKFRKFKMYTYLFVKINRMRKTIINRRKMTSKVGAFLYND